MSVLPYGLVIFLSAWALFLIQPLIAKILLPIFGGVPSVWNICMMFFQGILLLGYLYAHNVSKFSDTAQKWIHSLLLGASFFVLPLLLGANSNTITNNPTLLLLQMLLYKIALPLFILSSTSPLVQKWFSRTNTPGARDPYFLYSISNLGSLTALLSFPLLLEPFFGVRTLLSFWTALYCFFAITILIIMFQSKPQRPEVIVTESPINPVTTQRIQWFLLSFAPSSLLLGVTTFITTDIAATPLLWIIPFTIFLLTFIIAFARRTIIPHQWIDRNLIYFLFFPLFAFSKIVPLTGIELILFHLIGFFALCMICQINLAASRPCDTFLTEYYLWIAIGGFVGGLFNGIIAPIIFNGIYEYHLIMALCLFLNTRRIDWRGVSLRDLINPMIVLLALSLNYILIKLYVSDATIIINHFITFSVIVYILITSKTQLQLALNISILLVYFLTLPSMPNVNLILQKRNFFGLTRVYEDPLHKSHFMMNGNIIHGIQFMTKPMSTNQLNSYYRTVWPVSAFLQAKHNYSKVAIAGLGAGTLSCQFNADVSVDYYEIDPTVIQTAGNPVLFTYLKTCPPKKIIVGDARLNLAKAPAQYYDIIILDAFSSDSIPIHLITKEALQIYLSKLTSNGVILVHITNRYVDILPVLTSLTKHLGLYGLYQTQQVSNVPTTWVMITRNQQITNEVQNALQWKRLPRIKKEILWTDDFSNIVKVLIMRPWFF